ncbi:amino acid ABC transporter permease [[Clostridium] innocuum]|nr:amino acid ABC transporter permease [[Clostridium] innocuum]MCR0577964.1 amino acid ABC transporter permease [[Clostridium] innocuum]
MDFFIQLLPAFVEGLKITLFFWVVTLAGSFVLALPMVYVRLSRNAVVSSVVRFYIYIMRGTPLLLQLMFVYFGLPYLGIRLNRTTAAILAFLLNYTAYFTEILRGGIQSIDEGQKEAAKILGYSNAYTFLHILLPQALRNCIPSFINESLTLLKDTCLVSILGIDELLRYAKIAAGTYATGLPFIYVGVIYLVLNMPISRGLNYLEKRLNYYK